MRHSNVKDNIHTGGYAMFSRKAIDRTQINKIEVSQIRYWIQLKPNGTEHRVQFVKALLNRLG